MGFSVPRVGVGVSAQKGLSSKAPARKADRGIPPPSPHSHTPASQWSPRHRLQHVGVRGERLPAELKTEA